MANAGGAILTAAICAGGYIAYVDQQNRRRPQEPEIIITTPPAPPRNGPDFTPLLQWGFDMIGNMGSTNTKTGSNPLKRLFGGETAANSAGNRASRPRQGLEAALLGLIGSLEAPQGYDQVYGGSRLPPPRPITQMTVGEVLAWQDRSVAAGSRSSAAGRYQIIRKTLRALVRAGVVSTNERFDRATQDRLGLALMKKRGLNDYQSGRISAERFGNNLAKEWASLPVLTGSKRGRSYYAGDGLNHALTRPETVLTTIKGGYV